MINPHRNEIYILFVKETCPYCHMAVELLEQNSVPYKKVVLEDSSPLQREVKNAFDWQTVPIVFLKNDNMYELIGGFTDLEKLVNG